MFKKKKIRKKNKKNQIKSKSRPEEMINVSCVLTYYLIHDVKYYLDIIHLSGLRNKQKNQTSMTFSQTGRTDNSLTISFLFFLPLPPSHIFFPSLFGPGFTLLSRCPSIKGSNGCQLTRSFLRFVSHERKAAG